MQLRVARWGLLEPGEPVGYRHSAQVIGRFSVADRPPVFWLGLWVVVLALEFVALWPTLTGIAEPPWAVVYRVMGGSFAACGLVAWRRRPDSRVGALMTATGFLLFIYPVFSQVDSPTVLVLAGLFEDLWGIAFVALLLTFLTGGRLESRLDRVLVGLFALEFVFELSIHLFLENEGNFLLVNANSELAGTLDTARRWLVSASCVAVAVVVWARWRAASGARRRAMLPSVAGISSLLLFAVLQIAPSPVVVWLALCSLAVVPAAFLAGLLRSRLARGGLAELFRDLRSMRGVELQGALARALGDPSLRIGYPFPDGGYVDAEAQPITPAPGRRMVGVEHDGSELAVLAYDASLDDDPELVEAVTAAAAIALSNEARLAELQASRGRLVAAGDAERRRLERDLHDGAQQRLVGMALQLRLLRNRVGDDASAAALVSSVSDELAHSLAELRELARGIHPSVLDHGLDAALESLASRAPVPTSVQYEPGPSLPARVELAAYFVVAEALTNIAKYAKARAATVTVTRTPEHVVIEILDDGIGGAEPDGGSGLRGLADRVGALGGRLTVVSPPGLGTVVTAELPCCP